MLLHAFKTAIKVLLRRKFFTAASLFGISFTLVVLMVAAALFDHVFAPRAPEVNADRSLGVYNVTISGPNQRRTGPAGYRLLADTARDLPGAERVTFHSIVSDAVGFIDGERLTLQLKRTDGEFWRVFRFEFLEGGPFSAEDDAAARFVAVINESTRRRYFGDASALGKPIDVGGQRFRVVGVVPDIPLSRIVVYADLWAPIRTAPNEAYKTQLTGSFIATIVANSRADFPAIREEFRRRVSELTLPDRTWNHIEANAETLFETFATLSVGPGPGAVARLVVIIAAIALLFMLLPTLNLINLNVSRILERASEIGVRKAFGASSRALLGQFLVENVVLTAVGGALGLALSAIALEIVNHSGVIPYARFALNLRIFAYAMALTVFFGVWSGVYPAWKMSRLRPVEALRGGAR
ncbi:MAG TPA: ABC transporter permease [Kofleriaceae bacterium]|nr:ABC transporter permease [Kofleriaceae bacterium]